MAIAGAGILLGSAAAYAIASQVDDNQEENDTPSNLAVPLEKQKTGVRFTDSTVRKVEG